MDVEGGGVVDVEGKRKKKSGGGEWQGIAKERFLKYGVAFWKSCRFNMVVVLCFGAVGSWKVTVMKDKMVCVGLKSQV